MLFIRNSLQNGYRLILFAAVIIIIERDYFQCCGFISL